MKQEQVDTIRDFNRFFTGIIRTLNRQYLDSPFSLVEVRVLFEINAHAEIKANDILEKLYLDKGYLSRILKRLEKDGLVQKTPSTSDKRVTFLALTPKGKAAYDKINASATDLVHETYGGFSEEERETIVQCMTTIKQLLSKKEM